MQKVGEDISLQDILENESGKRGRGQQIIMLKSRVKKLEKELQSVTSKIEVSNTLHPKSEFSHSYTLC